MTADHEIPEIVYNRGSSQLVTEAPIGSHVKPLSDAPKAEEKPASKPLAVVVHMTPFAHNWPSHAVRSQIEAAFPGVPVIFVDSGTDVQVIHAVK